MNRRYWVLVSIPIALLVGGVFLERSYERQGVSQSPLSQDKNKETLTPGSSSGETETSLRNFRITESFDDYSKGALNTMDGGLGFMSPWQGHEEYLVDDTVTCAGSVRGVKKTSSAAAGEATLRRSFSSGVERGDLYVCLRMDDAHADYMEMFFIDTFTGARLGSVDILHASGESVRLRARHADGLTTLASDLRLNTWYIVHVRFLPQGSFAVRYKETDTTWSLFTDSFSLSGEDPLVGGLEFVNGNDGEGDAVFYIDEIRFEDPLA